jgi:hypothetical protein
LAAGLTRRGIAERFALEAVLAPASRIGASSLGFHNVAPALRLRSLQHGQPDAPGGINLVNLMRPGCFGGVETMRMICSAKWSISVLCPAFWALILSANAFTSAAALFVTARLREL